MNDENFDCDSEEQVNESDHDSESEIEVSSDTEITESDSEKDENYFTKTIYESIKGKGKKISEIYKWKKSPVISKYSKVRQKNILKKILPFVKQNDNIIDEISAFFKIIDIGMIDLIVSNTNLNIESRRKNGNDKEYYKFVGKDTSREEIMAVIGILYLIGLKKASKINLRELWANDGTGIELLRGVMSQNRFQFLLSAIRFDDKSTRKIRREKDKLAPIRDFLDSFVQRCKESYSPGEYITIDEKLEPFRGRCSFIQYIPKKPAKYGIKIFALVDAKTFYTNNLEVYCGKQPDGPYFVSNKPFDIVNRLIAHLKGSGRNLTTDNWYTSYPLAKSLLNDNITLLGTMRSNKKEIPREFLPSKSRQVGSTLFGFQNDISITSYVPKRNKAVILLSTMHDDASIDKETGKPCVIQDYNQTKCGVDVVDQLGGNYTVSRKTYRWPMSIFYALLNIAGINSQIILASAPNTASLKRRYFLKNLSLALIKPHLESRSSIMNLPIKSREIIKRHIAEKETTKAEEPPKKKGRCNPCGRAKNNNTTLICSRCKNFTCKNHMYNIEYTCIKCINQEINEDHDLSE